MSSVPAARAAALADRIAAAAEALVRTLETIPEGDWDRSRRAGEWSPGKDAEHVAQALALHLWVVRTSVGDAPGERPPIERKAVTASADRPEVLAWIQREAGTAQRRLRALTDGELDGTLQPSRARGEAVGRYIERVLIGHVTRHEADIRRKTRR